RRHTRFSRDWSSDVCSSDLGHASCASPCRMSISAPVAAPGAARPRVPWVDTAKGICIVMVVMVHAVLGVEADAGGEGWMGYAVRSEEHTSELQSRENLVCRL